MTSTTSDREPLVLVTKAVKTYGPTKALSGVELDVNAGEILGIVGHNGAGKSTLMRILVGLEPLDSGSVKIGGSQSPGPSGFPGVRMAYQEGSLALELSVKENVFLSSRRWLPRWNWHRPSVARAMDRHDEIFPHHGIGASDFVDDLPIADRQMVEIARATITDDLRLLILDEPTESLGRDAVEQLYGYVRKLRERGLAIILVSHRLKEVLSVCDRVAVMKDGAVVAIHRAGDVTERDLFLAMGGEVVAHGSGETAEQSADDGARPVEVRVPMQTVNGDASEIIARAGDVIGLAGIAGQGQERILDRLWRGKHGDVEVSPKRAYVPGDRQRSGILPLWNVAANLTISAVSSLARRGVRRVDAERALVSRWVDLLKIRGAIQPRIWSLGGMTLIMSPIVALAIASMAQMVMMSIGDIDLSIGFFVGMITAIVATLLRDSPVLGVLALTASVLGYVLIGALVELRGVPSLIATLGASFIWLGLGLFLLPVPGGAIPGWLLGYSMLRLSLPIPVPVITMVMATAITWSVVQRTAVGVRFRALGSNPVALVRSGASLLRTRMLAYAAVGLLGVLAGITLAAEIGGGDVNAVPGYTLTTIAAVILGGGMFTGGRAVAWGTLFGAVTPGLLTVLLTLLNLSSNLQPAVQGLIVIAVLAGRLLVERLVR